jgi:hypothetical protein
MNTDNFCLVLAGQAFQSNVFILFQSQALFSSAGECLRYGLVFLTTDKHSWTQIQFFFSGR